MFKSWASVIIDFFFNAGSAVNNKRTFLPVFICFRSVLHSVVQQASFDADGGVLLHRLCDTSPDRSFTFFPFLSHTIRIISPDEAIGFACFVIFRRSRIFWKSTQMATTPQTPPVRRVSRFNLRWYYWLLLLGAVFYGIASVMHWDDRGLLWVLEGFESPTEQSESVWLPDYTAVIDAKPLPGLEDDEASDLAYNPATKTLFSVMGKNPFLVELSLEGDVLRKIPLQGWSNPEGVTVMENGLLAIVDERDHMLTVVKVDAETQNLNMADFPSYDLGVSKDQNKAFEAIAWDPRRQQLLLGEERPPALYVWKSNGSQTLTGNKQKLSSDELDLRNLSALSIDPRTGHTLVLSADSHMLLELDELGEQVSFMTLLRGFNGLKNTIPRAEGVATDEHGTLYMVSEPNLFYRFEKAAK